jgi:hypothetical protein
MVASGRFGCLGTGVSHRGCVSILRSAAELSLSTQIGWQISAEGRYTSPVELAAQLPVLRARGQALVLPDRADRWFFGTFAKRNAAYALGFQYVWALAALGNCASAAAKQPARRPVDLVMWMIELHATLTWPDRRRIRCLLTSAERGKGYQGW